MGAGPLIFDSLLVKLALIGVLGIGAQWIAWRTNKPAIALMLVAGIVAGPVLGLIVPARDFGQLQQPIIKLAVAVILFEGGLSLNFRDLRHAGWPVARLVVIGVPLGAALGTAAAHWGAGLSLGVSALFGGILVVTGPTVIGPMLRSLRVPRRVRDTLKWEGIVNDPIGALLAIGIYGYITYAGPRDAAAVAFDVAAATLVAIAIGVALGFALTSAFRRGAVPEYLKTAVVLVAVIAGFVLADIVKHETGLITVTVMGVVMANRDTGSTAALRHFKEDLAVLLVSGVFIILSATLNWAVIAQFQWRFLLFLALLLFVVRPVTVLASLMLSRMPWRERLFVAWIAPRGVVAVAITGLFALRLQTEAGIRDAAALVPLAFGVVIATILAHGFSAGWVARRLGIDQGRREGVLLVGANRFTAQLAVALGELGLAVLVIDTAKFALRAVRKREVAVHGGDILDEGVQETIDIGQYQQVLAATESDAYNALVCADLRPELGAEHLAQIAPGEARAARSRGRLLLESATPIDTLIARLEAGWDFGRTRITDKFGVADYRAIQPAGAEPVALLKPDRRLLFFSTLVQPSAEAGDVILTLAPPA